MEPWRRYGSIVDDVAAFRQACEQPLPTAVRVNPIKTNPDAVRSLLARESVPFETLDWTDHGLVLETDSPGRTWAYQHGWIHGQEEISQLPPVLLAPDPGDVVWDAAAAPGGKATQLAAMVRNDGVVVANDVNLGRLAGLRSNADRLGVDNMVVTNRDARRYPTEDLPIDRFDHVLVDAPCSGEGTLRKNPTVLDEWEESALEALSGVQVGILRRAINLTAPGGFVLYSTCTFAPEENEAVLDRVLDDGSVELVCLDPPLTASPGVTDWRGEAYDPQVRRAARFYPHQNDTGGFFCAKLQVVE